MSKTREKYDFELFTNKNLMGDVNINFACLETEMSENGGW